MEGTEGLKEVLDKKKKKKSRKRGRGVSHHLSPRFTSTKFGSIKYVANYS